MVLLKFKTLGLSLEVTINTQYLLLLDWTLYVLKHLSECCMTHTDMLSLILACLQ